MQSYAIILTWLIESWITLFTGLISSRRIEQNYLVALIRWIAIYRLDCVLRTFNYRTRDEKDRC